MRYIAAMDIGTCTITMMVASIEGANVQILYRGEVPSEGVRYSYIVNPQRLTGPMKKAISDAESALNIKINQILVNLPRWYVRQQNATAGLEKDGNSCITQEEVDSVKNIALDDYKDYDRDNEALFEAVSQSFTVDDYHQIAESEVAGMVSRNVQGNFKIFSGSKWAVDNIAMACDNASVAFHTVFTPTATGRTVLSSDERETGVALIEMGGGVTSVSIFHDDILRYYASIPFGGKTVTADIKSECGLSSSLAENIKLAFGGCIPDKLPSLGDKTIRIDYEESGTEKQLPVKYLSEIITAREKEIVDAMLYYIQQSGYADNLRSGIVITGGGANMINMANFIRERSGMNVRPGFPLNLFSCGECRGVKELESATVLSMILSAKDKEWINCIDPCAPRNVPAAVPQEEEEKEQETAEVLTLVSPAAAETPEREKKKKKSDKPEKVNADRPKPHWFGKAKSIFNEGKEFFGTLYEGMNSDE